MNDNNNNNNGGEEDIEIDVKVDNNKLPEYRNVTTAIEKQRRRRPAK